MDLHNLILRMIKDDLISSLRFLKNKKFAFINSVGLTIGFMSLLLILFFVNHELSVAIAQQRNNNT